MVMTAVSTAAGTTLGSQFAAAVQLPPAVLVQTSCADQPRGTNMVRKIRAGRNLNARWIKRQWMCMI